MMVPVPALWLPIVLASALVFVASSVIHMLFTYHRNDFRSAPDEDGVMDALRAFDLAPGDYMLPYAGSAEAMRSEAFRGKVERGPLVAFTVFPPNAWSGMGPQLIQWFVYCLVVSAVAAYLGGRTLGPGADYLSVYRVVGTTAFACYALALPQRSIWFHQNWGATLRAMFDGFVYACLTAGAFGWLWPA